MAGLSRLEIAGPSTGAAQRRCGPWFVNRTLGGRTAGAPIELEGVPGHGTFFRTVIPTEEQNKLRKQLLPWPAICPLYRDEFFQVLRSFDPALGAIMDRPQSVSDNLEIALPEEFLRKTSVTSNRVTT